MDYKNLAFLLLFQTTAFATQVHAAHATTTTCVAAHKVAVEGYHFDTHFSSGRFTYLLDTEHKVARMVQCMEDATTITIPANLEKDGEKYTVVSVGGGYPRTFYYNTKIENISLPATLVEVYNNAFAGTRITAIDLPHTVTSIGDNAFNACNELAEVNLPQGLTTIGNAAFLDCTKLATISLPGALNTIGEKAFKNTALNTLTIPAAVTSIGQEAAPDCLSRLILLPTTPPKLDGSISSYLNSVNVPQGSAGKYRAADYWKNYVIVDGDGLALNVKVDKAGTLGDKILAQTTDFADVNKLVVSGTLNDDDLYDITNRLTSLIEIDLNATDLTAIPYDMFNTRKALRKIVLPARLQAIGNFAMFRCYDLQNVQFPATLKTIGISAFSECNTLEEVVLPEGFQTAGTGAFGECNSLKKVQLPSTMKQINGFGDCRALESVTLAEGATSIGIGAFSGAEALKEITLPQTLNVIGNRAFEGCVALTKVTIPSAVTECSYAFPGCANLKEVTCEALLPPYVAGNSVFGSAGGQGRTLYVPDLAVNSYKKTKGWNTFATIKGIDILPDTINVWKPTTLNLPDNLKADYKPDVLLTIRNLSAQGETGGLTVNGKSTLSMASFSMQYNQFAYAYYDYPCYTSLISNAPMRADNASIELTHKTLTWVFFTPPFDVNVSDITTAQTGVSRVIRSYSGANRAAALSDQTWQDVPANGVLKAGQGYILQSTADNDASTTFILPAADNANKNLVFAHTRRSVALTDYPSEFSHNRSWNLVGNPYPAFYDSRYMEFNAPFTIYNERDRTYEAYSPTDDSYILRPGEAFFVQKPVDVASIGFPTDGRQTDRNVRETHAPHVATVANAPIREVYNLYVSDGRHTDKTRFVLNAGATYGYDMHTDAGKFMSPDKQVPQLYTLKEGTAMAINERPEGDGQIALGFYAPAEGQYTIALGTGAARSVTLVDKATGTHAELQRGAYTFHATAGQTNDRFYVKMGGTLGVNQTAAPVHCITVTQSHGRIKVTLPRATGIVIATIDGRIVKDVHAKEVEVGAAPGMYVVQADGQTVKVNVTR